MSMARSRRFCAHALTAAALGGALASGCSTKEATPEAAAAVVAAPIGDATCATCGMVVRQQPAPRGQLEHRDGTRLYFCSLSDLAQYLAAPSPRGKPVAVFVETLDPQVAPAVTSDEARPWTTTDRAAFVLGPDRAGIMGQPVLAYSTRAEAEEVARAHGGRVLDWPAVQRELVK